MKLTITTYKLLFAAVCALLAISCQNQSITEIPPGFSLKWQSGPTHADRGAHEFIKIAASDNGYILTKGETFRFFSKEDGKLKDKTDIEVEKELPQQLVLKLCQLIVDEHILSMNERYRDPDIMDGDYKSLNIEWNGESKTISAINRTPDELKRVFKELSDL